MTVTTSLKKAPESQPLGLSLCVPLGYNFFLSYRHYSICRSGMQYSKIRILQRQEKKNRPLQLGSAMKRILYDTKKSENPGNYQHKFTNFCNIITSHTYKKGGETIEKKYVFYKPGNIYALYFMKENTICYNRNFFGDVKIICWIR